MVNAKQAEQQEKSLKTALEQQKAETAKAIGELQQQLAQRQKSRMSNAYRQSSKRKA